MVKQLPYELWEEIASNLPSGRLWYYRHLNSAFYNVALDNRYHTIYACMELLEPGQNWHNFLEYRDKPIGRRVRTILFQYQDDSVIPTVEAWPKLFSFLKRKVQKFSNRKHIKIIKSLIEGLVNVSHLVLASLDDDLPRNSMPIFDLTLRTSSSCLTSLRLHIHPAYIAEALKPDVFLPRLTSLSIGSHWGYIQSRFDLNLPSTSSNNTAGTITPFLNRHRSTLTNLELLVETDTNGVSPYKGLDHIPSLSSIAIVVSELTERRLTSNFLQMHSKSLRRLDINPREPTSVGLVAELVNDVILPFHDLQRFAISNLVMHAPDDNSQYDLGETADFIRRYGPSLVTLVLSHLRQMTGDFFAIFDHRKCTEDCYAKLRKLYMNFLVCTPEMLDILASRLPNLETLEIGVVKPKVNHDAPDEADDESKFCDAMLQRNYSYWKLKTIWFFSKDLATAGVAMAMTSESVQLFNNKTVKDFISEGPLAHLIRI